MALYRIGSTQQPSEHHHRTIAQSNPFGLQDQTVPIRTRNIKQSDGRKSHETNDGETGASNRRTKQISTGVSATITVSSRR
jgi:hypothetical protein